MRPHLPPAAPDEPTAPPPSASYRLRSPGGAGIELYLEEAVGGLSARLDPGSVDVVVTSPPYNLGVPYTVYQDSLPRQQYLEWIATVGTAIRRVLAPGGSFFLNIGGPPKDPMLPWAVAESVGRSLTLQNVIHWVKSIAIDRALIGRQHALSRDLVVGHYKPVNSKRYLHGAHEYVLHFTHSGAVELDRLAIGVPYEDRSNTGRWRGADRGIHCRGNTWFLPYSTIHSRKSDRPHPATFPPELADRCFRLHGVGRIQRAVDPFVGIGSSAVAAARLNLPFTGFDLDPTYLAEADRRLRAEGSRPVAATDPTPPWASPDGHGVYVGRPARYT